MVIAGDIDSLIDFFSFTALPPISQAITMAML
jgi:hypothetical protein